MSSRMSVNTDINMTAKKNMSASIEKNMAATTNGSGSGVDN